MLESQGKANFQSLTSQIKKSLHNDVSTCAKIIYLPLSSLATAYDQIILQKADKTFTLFQEFKWLLSV